MKPLLRWNLAFLVFLAPLGASRAEAPGGVEIKVTVKASQISRTRKVLRLADAGASVRSIYFFDTRGLDLFRRGVILRARKVKNDTDDSTAKIRPMDPSRIDSEWFEDDGFKCELDRVGSRAVESCSLTTPQQRGEIDAVAAGSRPIDKLFSSDQEEFLESYAPPSPEWARLVVLGPVRAKKWKVKPRGYADGLTAELWTLPDGKTILELSTKTSRARSGVVGRQFAAFLRLQRIDPSTAQETKTRAALEYFARRR